MATNLYETLEVSVDASPEQSTCSRCTADYELTVPVNDVVRKAYKKRALQTHPDRLPPGISAPEKAAAEERFRQVGSLLEDDETVLQLTSIRRLTMHTKC